MRNPLRRHARDDERRPGTQVRGLHCRPPEGRRYPPALDHRPRHGPAVLRAVHRRRARARHADPGPHALQLRHVLQPVLEHRLRHDGRALGPREQRHELRLHVRGEPGEGPGLDAAGVRVLRRVDAHDVLALHDAAAARGVQLGDHRGDVRGNHGRHGDARVGDGRRAEEGPRLDAVGDDLEVRAAQLLHALDGDGPGPRPDDLRPHGVEEVREVHDLGLLGGVGDYRLALGEAGRHEERLRGPHAGAVHVDLRPVQPARGGHGVHHRAAGAAEGDSGPHRLEALDVLLHRAGAYVAAAGEGKNGLPEAGQERADDKEARPERCHRLRIRLARVDLARVYEQRVAAVSAPRHRAPH
mmetsp:Transcript_70163/g.222457  ORF Transcript_70163/g.222457 Transcript_70163/m.222457 type:complete len:356 (+) Transcript_70163:178-1245(+)